MKAALGIAGLTLGALSAVVGIAALGLGLWVKDRRLLLFGRRAIFGVLAAAVIAVGAMEWALVTHDFSLNYVAQNIMGLPRGY